MTTLASILISLAVELLKVILQQHQAEHNAEAIGRLSGVIENLEAQKRAIAFKAAAARDPLAAGELRVRDGAGAVPIPGRDPRARRTPD